MRAAFMTNIQLVGEQKTGNIYHSFCSALINHCLTVFSWIIV